MISLKGKRTLLTVLLTVLFACILMFSAKMYLGSATDNVFVSEGKGSIRLSTNTGMRFRVYLDDETKNDIVDNDKVFGIFIFPASYMTTKDACLEEDYKSLTQKINCVIYDTSTGTDKFFKEKINNNDDTEYWVGSGVIANVYIQNMNKKFIAVGYIADGDDYTYAVPEDLEGRSVSQVSSLCYDYYNSDLTKQAIIEEFLEKSVLATQGVVEKTGHTGYTLNDTDYDTFEDLKGNSTIGLSVEESATVPLNLDYGMQPEMTLNGDAVDGVTAQAKYSSSDTSVATVNASGKVLPVSEGEAIITATIGDYSADTTVTVCDACDYDFSSTTDNDIYSLIATSRTTTPSIVSDDSAKDGYALKFDVTNAESWKPMIVIRLGDLTLTEDTVIIVKIKSSDIGRTAIYPHQVTTASGGGTMTANGATTNNSYYQFIIDGFSNETASNVTLTIDSTSSALNGASIYIDEIIIGTEKDIDKVVSFVSNDDTAGSVDVSEIGCVPYGSSITVSGNTITINGTTVTATANAYDNNYVYAFDSWDIDTDTVTEDMTITAIFTKTAYDYDYSSVDDIDIYTIDATAKVSTPSIVSDASAKDGYALKFDVTNAGSWVTLATVQLGTVSFTTDTYVLIRIKTSQIARTTIYMQGVTTSSGTGTVSGNGAKVDNSYYLFVINGFTAETKNNVTLTIGSTSNGLNGASIYIDEIIIEDIDNKVVSFVSNDDTAGSVDVAEIAGVPYRSSITVSGNTVTINGTTVTATASAYDNNYVYAFDSWDIDTDTVTEDITITAIFTKTAAYTITISAGSYGSVDETEIAGVISGSTITVSDNTITINGTTVTATANAYDYNFVYSFGGWSVSNGATVTGDMTIDATFIRIAYDYDFSGTGDRDLNLISADAAWSEVDVRTDANANDGYALHGKINATYKKLTINLGTKTLTADTYIAMRIRGTRVQSTQMQITGATTVSPGYNNIPYNVAGSNSAFTGNHGYEWCVWSGFTAETKTITLQIEFSNVDGGPHEIWIDQIVFGEGNFYDCHFASADDDALSRVSAAAAWSEVEVVADANASDGYALHGKVNATYSKITINLGNQKLTTNSYIAVRIRGTRVQSTQMQITGATTVTPAYNNIPYNVTGNNAAFTGDHGYEWCVWSGFTAETKTITLQIEFSNVAGGPHEIWIDEIIIGEGSFEG